ncbi:predicted protein [Uncinocarpus reesii 1704]|uniref:Something about silencing protein 4 domain-containing protein n=1 Tax=Uncinocarpus reesii (strain UAMH 1704) TaxID=336963 RepID=C4JIL8_UNCRE|nr:uncharacterized protein UREG_01555 [Uncinocarpus reesii 1704]EEP76706.1 predicted protein [Uncinocarpus reesii 1704]
MKDEYLSTGSRIILANDITVFEPFLEPTIFRRPVHNPPRALQKAHSLGHGKEAPLLDVHQTKIIFDLALPASNGQLKDPLSNGVFFKAHRKNERKETQLRNIEKERAQHQQIQLDRLLVALQGADWVRVMGISGITESEKKLYEPKRAYFIMELTALLEKFKFWKEKEKRRKAEQQHLPLKKSDSCTHEASNSHRVYERGNWDEEDIEHQYSHLPSEPLDRLGDDETDDIDAWAAHQLHQEALSALPQKYSKPGPQAQVMHPTNAQAIGRNPPSRSEVKLMARLPDDRTDKLATTNWKFVPSMAAFGQIMPQIQRSVFLPPRCILTEEAIRDCLRRKRRRKRERLEDD